MSVGVILWVELRDKLNTTVLNLSKCVQTEKKNWDKNYCTNHTNIVDDQIKSHTTHYIRWVYKMWHLGNQVACNLYKIWNKRFVLIKQCSYRCFHLKIFIHFWCTIILHKPNYLFSWVSYFGYVLTLILRVCILKMYNVEVH